jgi:DNA-nicking Smr family endonuclease
MAKAPERPRAAKRPARPTADELALFRAVMADAVPIERRGRKKAAKTETPDEGPTETGIEAPVPAPAKPRIEVRAKAPPPAPRAAPTLTAGEAAGVDRRTMEKLRKGRMRPEGVIDLHGMTAAAAHRALGSFLGSAQGAGKRCVLVVTGKGSLKEGGGVIRRELPSWLNAPENRGRIIGFSQARPGDGGAGAFYVLLKRLRR